MEQKKYMDIERLKDKYVDGFQPGDHIIVQEKIDGANFSIRYDEETDSIKAFSRKKPLDLSNNLRGAWEWSQRLNENFLLSNILHICFTYRNNMFTQFFWVFTPVPCTFYTLESCPATPWRTFMAWITILTW